jgi:hypothetical protein
MNHLYDDEIQMILDGDTQVCTTHAEKCAACNQKIEDYRILYQELHNLEPEQIPADFTDRVMIRLPAPKREFLWTAFEKLCLIFAGLVSVISLFYWIDWLTIFKITSHCADVLKQIPQYFRIDSLRFNSSLSETVLWIGAGLFVLIILMSLDKLLAPKHESVSLHS